MSPNVTYIVNGRGERVFVQLPVEDWNKLMSERERLVSESKLRSKLRRAIRESERIHRGESKGVTLDKFLDEM